MSQGGQDFPEYSGPHQSYGNHVPDNTGDQAELSSQELIDMVHEKRGVIPGAEPEANTPKRPTRITHHEIKAMKVTVRKESSPIVGLFRRIGGFFSVIIQAISSLFTSRRLRVDGCAENGHTFPKHWQGDFPRCVHCQALIKKPPKSNK